MDADAKLIFEKGKQGYWRVIIILNDDNRWYVDGIYEAQSILIAFEQAVLNFHLEDADRKWKVVFDEPSLANWQRSYTGYESVKRVLRSFVKNALGQETRSYLAAKNVILKMAEVKK